MNYVESKLNKSNGKVNLENQGDLENPQNNSDSGNETIGNSLPNILKLIKENKLNKIETIEP